MAALADKISKAFGSDKAITEPLHTSERVIARITDGIYRQPSSALRELISNAYDADAKEVVILTDAPRFSRITIRDNGHGLTPEALEHMVQNIGGSAKRRLEGAETGDTDKTDPSKSPGGRTLIGKMGIGLFSVAQFTRHFLIITKTKGAKFRTIADITLGPIYSEQRLLALDKEGNEDIEAGCAKIWIEPAAEKDAQGTEITLLDLLPRTKAELASNDFWTKRDFQLENKEENPIKPPRFHIGQVFAKDNGLHKEESRLPWKEEDKGLARFARLVEAVRSTAASEEDIPSLDTTFDNYLRMLWTIALWVPVAYMEEHPFDLTPDGEMQFFLIENKMRGRAADLPLGTAEKLREKLNLKSPAVANGDIFKVLIDEVEIRRPILFHNQPKTKNAIKTPLLFAGKYRPDLSRIPESMRGGDLEFEAYLFWTPKVVPKEHQGVIIRVGNASGTLFDPTFMGYQVSEQNRLRQITAEIFVTEGLDGAINIDRESFNTAHPHFQAINVWLHSALRQLTNRQKEIGKILLDEKRSRGTTKTGEAIEDMAAAKSKARGSEDTAEVILLDAKDEKEATAHRRGGKLAMRRQKILPEKTGKKAGAGDEVRRILAEKKAVAVAQILDAWGLLENLSFDEQEQLVRDILDVTLFEGDE
jgi:hypothetical protein